MAKPEQTEKATPKRRDEVRKKGQVARSPELSGAAIFLVGVIVIHNLVPRTMFGIEGVVSRSLEQVADHQPETIKTIFPLFVSAFAGAAEMLLVLFAVAMVVGVLANVLQFGFLFTLKPLTSGVSRLNPLTGIKQLFSRQVLVNLIKQLVKLAAVAVILFSAISGDLSFFVRVGQVPLADTVILAANLIYGAAWKFGVLLVLVAIADYLYQKHQLESSIKMTKQEVKDEHRQSEGSPEAKGAFKRRQREFARRRMMSAVPRATVVVTNPTHFAVALEWDEIAMEAPVVTAKGSDLLALRIREIARENGVPIMENPPLARTLYERVELDQAIPPNLYAAVAQVIAFVFKLKRKTIA